MKINNYNAVRWILLIFSILVLTKGAMAVSRADTFVVRNMKTISTTIENSVCHSTEKGLESIRPGPTTVSSHKDYEMLLKKINSQQKMSNKQLNRLVYILDSLNDLGQLENLDNLNDINSSLKAIRMLLYTKNVESNYLVKESQTKLQAKAQAYLLYPFFVIISLIGLIISVKNDYQIGKILFLFMLIIFLAASIYMSTDYLIYKDLMHEFG